MARPQAFLSGHQFSIHSATITDITNSRLENYRVDSLRKVSAIGNQKTDGPSSLLSFCLSSRANLPPQVKEIYRITGAPLEAVKP
jgi:hypothetical protein